MTVGSTLREGNAFPPEEPLAELEARDTGGISLFCSRSAGPCAFPQTQAQTDLTLLDLQSWGLSGVLPALLGGPPQLWCFPCRMSWGSEEQTGRPVPLHVPGWGQSQLVPGTVAVAAALTGSSLLPSVPL